MNEEKGKHSPNQEGKITLTRKEFLLYLLGAAAGGAGTIKGVEWFLSLGSPVNGKWEKELSSLDGTQLHTEFTVKPDDGTGINKVEFTLQGDDGHWHTVCTKITADKTDTFVCDVDLSQWISSPRLIQLSVNVTTSKGEFIKGVGGSFEVSPNSP